MTITMSSTIAKPPKPLRLNQRAQLLPAAQFAAWYKIAAAAAGLSELDRKVLTAIAGYYEQRKGDGNARPLRRAVLDHLLDTEEPQSVAMWNLSNRIAACGALSFVTLRNGFHMSITASLILRLFLSPSQP